ncbi:hypothetical protein N7495_006481 [Penicillium taxi]|uniref:uncharacterized protein n=1 Tax=Penicillium taxi TaxID=168475 RepID=UPI0025457517|nr:uncharacterized protein N7495_006481 [Penicillium taxi]KAJ5894790.1 hypothetical protein N7495_006481 [Penicillium taxi]
MANRPNAPPAHQIGLDGRETDLLHWIYQRSDIKQLHGNPTAILKAIDEYNTSQNLLINVGAAKGAVITDLVTSRKPSLMIELGAYVGYSGILFGNALKSHGGKLISIEMNPELAAVSNQLLELAGLRDTVRVIVGSSANVLVDLVREKKEFSEVDFVFVDHWQDAYLPDMWLLEELSVLVPGKSVVVADNVIFPGAPAYLEWVQANSEKRKELLKKADVGSLVPNPDLTFETIVHEFQLNMGEAHSFKDGVSVTKIL